MTLQILDPILGEDLFLSGKHPPPALHRLDATRPRVNDSAGGMNRFPSAPAPARSAMTDVTPTLERLGEAIATVPVSPNHVALLSVIRAQEGLPDARLLTHRGDSWLSRRKVLTAAGDLLADDHGAWLGSELARDAGDARVTIQRLRALDYQLTQCEVDTLYIVQDLGGAQDNFLQLEIAVEEEFIDRRLFSLHDWRSTPAKDLAGLVREAEDGERYDSDHRQRQRPAAYCLRRVVHVGAFVDEAAAVDLRQQAAQRSRLLRVGADAGSARRITAGALVEELGGDPGPYTWRGRRLFNDWTLASPGRSGLRFCEHWAVQLTDWTSPPLGRSMSLIPLWTHKRKIAEITRNPNSVHELYGKLESIDRRVGVPFGWYFYMLHGNLIADWAGRRILDAAEAGQIVLPEHDYQVLKRWRARPYGF